MKARVILILVILFHTLIISKVFAHPGSGIVADKKGQIYFTDTGKGVWKIDLQGKLTYMPSSRFHWMAIDEAGYFAASQKNFGGFFERVTPQGSKPVIIICSDFTFTINKDGNIYYADTRRGHAQIVRRTPRGEETVLASDKAFEFIHGITAGADGSLYITEASNPDANTIRKITLDGRVSIVATFVGKSGKDLPLETTPSYCRGLAADATGNLYVVATGSRSVLKVTPRGVITTILQVSSPWAATGVTLFNNEVYLLEWHDVTPENLEVRPAWIPRVRKIGQDGKVVTLATVSRE